MARINHTTARTVCPCKLIEMQQYTAAKAHEAAAKLRMGASNTTDSLFEILDCNKKPIAKAKTIGAATRVGSGDPRGVRQLNVAGPYCVVPSHLIVLIVLNMVLRVK